ncbi:hypothetical protein BKA70DRAFT_405771 [Coprinopsis sp. MPI-PUGE-AT-0042]|nr:hypothetical protein BKA70DRAFT_405771 [Coprinopsis sp. MPI-PUGE-AT-0042]
MFRLTAKLLQLPLSHMWRERLRRFRDRLQGRKGKQQRPIPLTLPKPLASLETRAGSLSPVESPDTPSFDGLKPSPFAYAHDFNIESLIAFEAKTMQYNVFQGHPTATGGELLLQSIACNALYDAGTEFSPPKCSKETREELISKMWDWITKGCGKESMLVLTGLAGTGKSSLMHTMAEKAENAGLNSAAWFFGKCDHTRNSKQRLIATLAYQLGLRHPEFQGMLHATIQHDPSILTKNVTQQFNALIIKPWKAISPPKQTIPFFVLFIDALDECQSDFDQRDILEGLVNAITLVPAFPLRVVLASRPEDFVRNVISPSEELAGLIHHIRLEDYSAIEEIRKYLSTAVRLIRQNHPARHSGQLNDWPSPEDFEALVLRANGHWIYADTVIHYLMSHDGSPIVRLQEVLRTEEGRGTGPFRDLDDLYSQVLFEATVSEVGQYSLATPRKIARLVWLASFFQSKGTVGQIEIHLDLEFGELRHRLSKLGSLVSFSTQDIKDPNTGGKVRSHVRWT